MKIKPKNIKDVAICLSIIRPAAKKARESLNNFDESVIFDDDAIDIIKNILNCTDSKADKYRRKINKDSKKTISDLKKKLEDKNYNKKDIKSIISKLNDLRKYSFCKSHAYSYAQLVWRLAYQKAHNPKIFWKSTIKHCQSSYKKWVHLYEARLVGVKSMNNKIQSIYAENRNKNILNLSIEEQLRTYGYWKMENKDFFPNCYSFISDGKYYYRGIIANTRLIFRKNYKYINIFIGIDKSKYLEVFIKHDNINLKNKIGIKGYGISEDGIIDSIKCDAF